MTSNFLGKFVINIKCVNLNISFLISASFVQNDFQFTYHVLVQWSLIRGTSILVSLRALRKFEKIIALRLSLLLFFFITLLDFYKTD